MNEHGADARLLVENIARALVDAPDKVTVEAVEHGDATVLNLRVAPEDVGKVIGKQGRTARSLRTIVGAAGIKQHKRYSLEILE
ncbi:MAG: KH domain-containing protein [Acidobacteria bacterium]|nr:KH domain-containing protein [Acidobacteriota bacterium]